MRLNTNDEPVRLGGWAALTVGCVLLAAIGWSQGLDVRAIVGQVAVVALASISGLEFARHRVWSPASLDEIASAEAALGSVTLDDVE
jgi:hypothetical protein